MIEIRNNNKSLGHITPSQACSIASNLVALSSDVEAYDFILPSGRNLSAARLLQFVK
jgi:hypothetical protein